MKKTLAIEHAFVEYPFYRRFSLAREEGFAFVELGDWTELDFSAIHLLQKELSLGISAISGSRGHTLTEPGSRAFVLEHLAQSIAVARSFGILNLILDFAPGTRDQPGHREKTSFAADTLLEAVKPAAKVGLTLQLKPTGSPGRPVTAEIARTAAEVVRAVDSPALRLLYDATSTRRPEGETFRSPGDCRDIIGYVHVSNPSEADCAAENFSALRNMLAEELRFTGFVGFSFAAGTRETRCLEAVRRF